MLRISKQGILLLHANDDYVLHVECDANGWGSSAVLQDTYHVFNTTSVFYSLNSIPTQFSTL